MIRRFASLCLIALPAAFFAGTQEAEAQVRFGPQITLGDDWDLGLGGRLTGDVDIFSDSDSAALRSLRGIGEVIYYLDPICDDCDAFEVNLNGVLPVRIAGSSTDFYAGGGLNIATLTPAGGDGNTELGLNILGGLNFALGNFAAFAEAAFRLEGSEQFAVTGGILLGGR